MFHRNSHNALVFKKSYCKRFSLIPDQRIPNDTVNEHFNLSRNMHLNLNHINGSRWAAMNFVTGTLLVATQQQTPPFSARKSIPKTRLLVPHTSSHTRKNQLSNSFPLRRTTFPVHTHAHPLILPVSGKVNYAIKFIRKLLLNFPFLNTQVGPHCRAVGPTGAAAWRCQCESVCAPGYRTTLNIHEVIETISVPFICSTWMKFKILLVAAGLSEGTHTTVQ